MQITKKIAQHATTFNYDDLSHETVTIAKQCILDWTGVTLAAQDNEVGTILRDEYQNDHLSTSLLGSSGKASLENATLINGVIGHVLDYDDTNMYFVGHPTAATLPSVLSLAEQLGSSGKEIINAFVAGYESACHIAGLLWTPHYQKGFHGSATIGAFSAAMACARLLEVDVDQMEMAIGLAATQSAGLKMNNGTMSKSFQVGKASVNGLIAAKLAARGYKASADSLEHNQGYLTTHTTHEAELEIKPMGHYIKSTMFKHHAACHLIHPTIESLSEMMNTGLTKEQVDLIEIEVPKQNMDVCGIDIPKTGLETKFSMKHVAAMTLEGINTADLSVYNQMTAEKDSLKTLAKKVKIIPDRPAGFDSNVTVVKKDGSKVSKYWDMNIPPKNLNVQQQRLDKKFKTLTDQLLIDKSENLRSFIANLEDQNDISELFELAKIKTN